jgi:hypothetical protein
MDLAAPPSSGAPGGGKSKLTLPELVRSYLALAGSFGRPVPLSAFDFGREETERLFSALDEDYHISRFLEFTQEPSGPEDTYSINSFPQTHVAMDPEIETIL